MSRSLWLRAFAKINLGLKVLGPRIDGYHEIRTIYQTIELHDRLEVTLTRKPTLSVECSDSSIPSGRDNLVYRACELWRQASKFSAGVRVEIEKRIPAGSGLGGGSSDAAAALLGLEKLAGKPLDARTRFQLAAQLGSDVPLFLLGGRVLGCGRGEEVYPLTDLPGRHCLVVYPGIHVSSAEAYRQIDGAAREALTQQFAVRPPVSAGRRRGAPRRAPTKLTSNTEARRVKVFGVWSQFPMENWGPAENDFEQVVFAKWPELEEAKIQLIRAGAETASLTGSGSALYAIFDSVRQLNHVSKALQPGWAAFRTRTLSRQQYHRMLFE